MYKGVEMHVCMEEWRCTCVWRSGDARVYGCVEMHVYGGVEMHVYGGVEMHVCMEEWRCTCVWRSGDAGVYCNFHFTLNFSCVAL